MLANYTNKLVYQKLVTYCLYNRKTKDITLLTTQSMLPKRKLTNIIIMIIGGAT